MYAHEAWRTISKLAGREVPGFETPVGREQPFEMGTVHMNDDRFHFEQTYNDGSSYKWLLVPDTIHNFDQRIGGVVRDVDFRQDAEDKTQVVMKEIGEWLVGPFHGTPSNANGAITNGEGANGTTVQHQIEQ